MKRELRCSCHDQLLGYEITPGEDHDQPISEPPRYAQWQQPSQMPAGHMPLPDCGDCGATPGQPHTPGCDVERCKNCGWQAIACGCASDLPPTTWTGHWPGKAEVEEYGLQDLNELASLCHQGLMTWDSTAERWHRP